MKQAFEDMAESYDAAFTNTLTGRYQRASVWQHLDHLYGKSEPKRILEVNCGTGEDAIYLARMGHDVLATDVSGEMIQKAQSKLPAELEGRLRFEKLNILDINTLNPQQFNLIFSDFGGLNCLSPDELDVFLSRIPGLLKPKGRFIAVVMPKFCFMESLYFLLKLDVKKAFRRNTNNHLNVQLIETSLPIWYYNPKYIAQKLSDTGKRRAQKGIGIFIPPSYLDEKFSRFRLAMKALGFTDSILSRISLSAYISDHFLIDIEMKK